MPGKGDMHSGFAHGLNRFFMAPNGFAQFVPHADRHREQGVMRNENPDLAWRDRTEALLHEADLLLVDAPILERERARGVEAQHRDLTIFEPRAEDIVDVVPIALQRCSETSYNIVERYVVIAGHQKKGMACRTQSLEIVRRRLKLMRARALREVARNDDEVRPLLAQPLFCRRHDGWIVCAKMYIGQVRDAGHEQRNEHHHHRFIWPRKNLELPVTRA